MLIFFLATFYFFFPAHLGFEGSRDPAQNITSWPQWSGDIRNNHNLTPVNPFLAKHNVDGLKVAWTYPTLNNVVSPPTYKDGTIYFTETASVSLLTGLFSSGRLHAVDASTGKRRWVNEIQTYTKSPMRNFSRSSPAIVGNTLVIGDSINNIKFIARSALPYVGLIGTSVMGINRHTGKLLWKTVVEKHFASRITMSPVIYDNKVFVGVSSQESEIPAIRRTLYKCCSFRGSLVALDVNTGKLLWKTPMIGANVKEVAGVPVWGSSPPIDTKRRRIYIGTGNNYNASKAMIKCYILERQLNQLSENEATIKCARLHDSPDNRFDALVALNIDTGKIIWTKKTNAYDAWNVGCGSSFTTFPPPVEKICPNPPGPDGDFAQAPMLITTKIKGRSVDLLLAGQKNGMFWALNAENGSTVWSKQVGPGGKLGGHQWGSATDGERVYFQTTNFEHKPIRLEVGLYKGRTIKGGYWGALDARTGELIWQTPDPATAYPLTGKIKHILYGEKLGLGYFAAPMGALTYYNDMIFAGSLSGYMVALDADNGRILWQKKNKGSVVSSPSIVDDTIFWGMGYHMGFSGSEVMALRP